jgi:hypothetical protein
MGYWMAAVNGHYLTCSEGRAFIGLWLNPSFVYAIIFFNDGRVVEVPHMDGHQPFEGVMYKCASDRAKAVVESIICPKPDTRPTAWDKIGVEEE